MIFKTSTLAVQSICRDARALPAGGATEMEVARQLGDWGAKKTGLDQYAVAEFARALEVVPRTIADNSGASLALTLATTFQLRTLPDPRYRTAQRQAHAPGRNFRQHTQP